MSSGVTIKVDTKEFQRTLTKYLEVSKKEVTEILNAKAFFVTLRALKETPKVEAGSISRELNQTVAVNLRKTKKGTLKRNGNVKRIYLILNARKGKSGQKGLYGEAMEAESKHVVESRIRARSFLKSGWLPALRDLAKKVPSADRYKQGKVASDVKIYGRDKGVGKPSTDTFKPIAYIENSAQIKGKSKARAQATMQAALQRAIAAETASMEEYITKKMQPSAKEASGKK